MTSSSLSLTRIFSLMISKADRLLHYHDDCI
jgi:hypothetical protein